MLQLRVIQFCGIIFWMLTAQGTPVIYDCPVNWVRSINSCYYFYFLPARNFENARQICQVQGAHLLEVDSQEEFTFISDWLTRNDHRKEWKWWVSSDGQFTSNRPDSQMFESPEFWADHTQTTESVSGQRVVFEYSETSGKFKWAWSQPDTPLSSICEIGVKDAFRILNNARDHLYGTNITDPNAVRTGPKFIQQPKSFIVVDSVTFQIECEVQSNPDASYRWLRNGSPLELTSDDRYTVSTGKLTINRPAVLKDEGSYQCLATNEIGAVLSDPGSVSFGFLAEFSNDPPGGVTARLYQGLAINCGLPSYSPAVDVKWYKEDGGPNFLRTDLQPHQFSSFNGKLYFSEVSTSDAGIYHCVVSIVAYVGQEIVPSHSPSRTSLGMKLNVIGETPIDYGPEIHNDFPAIFPSPALRGETLTIECFAYGKLPLHYTWKRENSTMPSKVTYSDSNRVLTLPNAELEDGGVYTCTVDRGNSFAVHKSIHLLIEARPFFTFPLVDQHIDQHGDFVWVCEAQGLPPPVYTWYKDGKVLNSQNGNIEVRGNVLRIHDALITEHQGMYQCAATNIHGTTFSSAQLRILAFKPSFARRPVNPSQMGTEGGNITITCQPESAPPANITWMKDGVPLPVSTNLEDRVMQLITGDLVIKDLLISDKGVYLCKASNEFGSDSSSCVLTIASQTTMTIFPTDTQAEVNSTVFLACQASYDVREKDLVYVWDFNGRNVLDLLDTSFKPDFQGSIPGLYILSVQTHHTGVYGCSTVTVDTRERHTAYLQVLGPPGESGGVKAEISGHKATIKWTPGPTNMADITKFHIEFNTNFNNNWRILSNNILLSETVDTLRYDRCTYTIDDLKPGTSYRFRIVAYNIYGPGPASVPSVLYKVPDAAPISVVDGITDTWGPVGILAVTWNVLSDEDLTGNHVGYKIYYRKKSNSDKWEKGQVYGPGNTFFAVIGADNYYLEYEVKIAAFNEFGEGPNSTVQVVMSQADMPVGVATNVTLKTYNSTAILVRWTPIPMLREYIRGKIIGYSINYWIKEGDMDSSNMYCSETCDSVLLIGLVPKSYYWVNIQVVNTAGTGMLSENYFGRTWRKAPESYPEYVQVHSYDGDSMFVSWRGVSTGRFEETLKGYKIRWWPMNKDIRTANVTVIPEKLTRAILHGIEPRTVYSLRVMAYNRGGDGRNSPTVYFTLEGQVVINPETTEVLNKACFTASNRNLYIFILIYLFYSYCIQS